MDTMSAVRPDAALSSRSWSTAEVAPRHALSYWVETVCNHYLELGVAAHQPGRFAAQLEQIQLGPALMNNFVADTQLVSRTRAHVARSDHGFFILLQLRRGRIQFRQAGKETQLLPGECVFINGTESYELDCPEATAALGLRFPEQWLKRWIPSPGSFSAHLFSNTNDWNGALCAAMTSLQIQRCTDLALPPDTVAEQIASLIALSLGRESQTVTRRNLLEELQGTLRDRLYDSTLSPETVAAQHHISKRTLHYAFSSAKTTFSEQLLTLRMVRAKEILSDRRRSELSITEVAELCGFMDPSHFARRFRERFEVAPLQFRARNLQHAGR